MHTPIGKVLKMTACSEQPFEWDVLKAKVAAEEAQETAISNPTDNANAVQLANAAKQARVLTYW